MNDRYRYGLLGSEPPLDGEVSFIMSSVPTMPLVPDIIWNRCDLRYGNTAEWCTVQSEDVGFSVSVYRSGDRMWAGILFVPLSPDAVSRLFSFLFERYSEIRSISYQFACYPINGRRVRTMENESVCYCLELDPDAEKVFAHSGRKTRYNLKRSERLLEEAAGPLGLLVFDADKCPPEIIDAYRAMKSRRFPGELSAGDVFGSKILASHVYALSGGGGILSVLATEERCDVATLVNIAYDPGLSRYSPGVILYAKAIGELCKKGKRFFYLGSGEYAYKKLFSSKEMKYWVGDALRYGTY